jgi:putative nucleotidyltransferase with HDIG domain
LEANALLKDSQRYAVGFTTSLLEKIIFEQPRLARILSLLASTTVADVTAWASGDFVFSAELPDAVTDGPVTILEEDIFAAVLQTGRENSTGDERILRMVAQKIATTSFHMPLLPQLIAKLEKLWDNAQSAEILQIAYADQVLTAYVLRVINAGVRSMEHPCLSLSAAERLYSPQHICGIIRAKAVTAQRAHQSEVIAQAQQHALNCALLAEQIAAQLGADTQLAYTCALLHNIGKAALIQLFADAKAQDPDIDEQIEKMHQNTGALLARRWNLPSAIYTAIRFYKNPAAAEENGLYAQIVYLSHNVTLNSDWMECCKEQCPDINFELLHSDAIAANLVLSTK